MGNLPVVHEGRTVVQSVVDQISGHPERARERWDRYYNESILVNLAGAPINYLAFRRTMLTAEKLKTNFLRIDPDNEQFPAHEPKDVVIVMDGSASLRSDEFTVGKTALKKLIGLEGQGGTDTKYAAVTFSNSAVVNFSFLPYTKAANEILTIPYPDGESNAQAGLEEAIKLFADPLSGRRTNATKIVLLVTDGLSSLSSRVLNFQEPFHGPFQERFHGPFQEPFHGPFQEPFHGPFQEPFHGPFHEPFIKAADKLKNSGVKIFVVAVGTFHVNGIDELMNAASSPPDQFLFRVTSLQSFLDVVEQFYSSFQHVTPHYVTAEKLKTNFLRIDPVNEQFPTHEPKDVVIVMDGSASLGSDEFTVGKTALKKLIGLEGHGGTDTKYAAVTFSNSAVVNFLFLPYTEAANEILTIPYSDGKTNTQAGLEEAMKLFADPSSGRRTTATKIVFLVTDGLSSLPEPFIKVADKLKNSGVKIFVVAVGTFHVHGIDEMVNAASSPPDQFLFRVESLQSFLDVVEQVSSSLYDPYNVVPSHIVTARKLINNFMFSNPVNAGSPTQVLTKDIVVVLDGSGSIGKNEFNKGTTALRNMIELERESGNDTKYAAVTFSDSADVDFSFLPYTEAATEICKIPYPSGQTNTQAGLAKAKTLFDAISSSGHRVNAMKNVFLVTDGHSNVNEGLTIPMADELKKSGVQIFVVAVGSYIDGVNELVYVASSPPEQFLFRVESLEGFLRIVQLAVKEIYPGKYVVR